jgi:hypothetical protein
MSHYRKIDVKIWNDEKFVSLSVHGQLAFVMLLTHPMMTALGAMRGTPGGLVEELCRGDEGLREAFREAFRDIFGKGMAEHDEKSSVIALPNFLRYNLPESPNVVKAWVKAAELIPESRLKDLTIQRAVGYAEALSKGFKEAIPEAFRKATPKPSPKTYPYQRAESSEPGAKEQEGSGLEGLMSTRAGMSSHPEWSETDWRLYESTRQRDIDMGLTTFMAERNAIDKVEGARRHREGMAA